jgi:predicted murein hydrolase (TIGR00659 family)
MSAIVIPQGPILWMPITIGIYHGATLVQKRLRSTPLLNPTLATILAIAVILVSTKTSYETYFQSVSILHYLLGTTVVAMAIPLHRNLRFIERNLAGAGLALLAGSIVTICLCYFFARELGAPNTLLLSLAPRSATTAVSMEISRKIGGIPALTACFTILTGIIGAMLGPGVLNSLHIRSEAARGLAMGTISHGIATARAFSESELTGCWASLAMALNAIVTAVLVPPIVHFATAWLPS